MDDRFDARDAAARIGGREGVGIRAVDLCAKCGVQSGRGIAAGIVDGAGRVVAVVARLRALMCGPTTRRVFDHTRVIIRAP